MFYQALFSLCQICPTIFLVMQENVLKFLSGKYTELTFYLVDFLIYSMLLYLMKFDLWIEMNFQCVMLAVFNSI